MTPVNPPSTRVSTLTAVFLLSMAMLAFELTLTRLFALAQFYHFAFMVVSLALLGLGASGSLLSVRPGLGRHPGWWSAAFAFSALASFVIWNGVPFDSYAIAWDRRQVLFLVLTFTGTAVPFICSGLVIGGLLASDARGLHRIYGASMVGSALGSLIVPPLVGVVGAESTVLVEAAMGLCAAGLFWRSGTWARQASVGLAFALVSSVTLLALAAARPDRLAIRLSPYKALSQALLAPDARHTVSAWTATARIDVVESGSIHQLPGLSQNAVFPRPPTQAGLTIDGDNLTPITVLAPDDPAAQELASHVPQAIVPALMPGASQLILEPAGGWDVLMALAGDDDGLPHKPGTPRGVNVGLGPMCAGCAPAGQTPARGRWAGHGPRAGAAASQQQDGQRAETEGSKSLCGNPYPAAPGPRTCRLRPCGSP